MIRRMPRALLGVALFLSTAGFVCQDDDPGDPVWAGWGGNVANTHHAAGETAIGPDTVAGLRPLWSVTTGGNVSAIPSLSETRVYVPDWGIPNVGGSQLWTVDRATGDVIAQKKLVEYSKNLINNVSRTTPAIYGDLLIFGDIRSQPTSVLNIPGGHGAVVYAVSRITGELVWKTTLDDHPLAIITQSPTVHGGVVYVGTSSHEEAAARLGYPCCSFRGTMAAIEASTGVIKWRTRTIPDQADPEAGFSGGSVWGSAPSVDAERGVVYVATGNNYRVGAELEACIDQHPGDPEAQETLCYQRLDPPDNYAESILALDLDDGAIRWARKMKNYGAWTFACDPELVPWLPRNSANCEDLDSMDYDFGQAPMIVRAADGAPRDLLVLGQKSGVLWALDPDDDGATVWATAVGPGGVLGGMEFGSATDGQRAYVQITNFRHNEFQLVAGPYAGQTRARWHLGGGRPRDRRHRLADARPDQLPAARGHHLAPDLGRRPGPRLLRRGARPADRRQRRRVRRLDGSRRAHVRLRRGDRARPVELRQRRLGQQRAGHPRRRPLLGVRLLERLQQRQAVRLRPVAVLLSIL
jgi:polyvinyl alcohol dehydrogenase (cytochrome)